jgi:hypothetical protein
MQTITAILDLNFKIIGFLEPLARRTRLVCDKDAFDRANLGLGKSRVDPLFKSSLRT